MKNAKRFTAIILSALMAASVFSAVTVSACLLYTSDAADE